MGHIASTSFDNPLGTTETLQAYLPNSDGDTSLTALSPQHAALMDKVGLDADLDITSELDAYDFDPTTVELQRLPSAPSLPSPQDTPSDATTGSIQFIPDRTPDDDLTGLTPGQSVVGDPASGPLQTSKYSSTDGYGLVDAAAAVAKSLGSNKLPNVANAGYSWSNNLINAPEVWNKGFTGEGVTVAVIDTGLDINHPDLDDNVWVNTGEIAGDGIDNDGNGYVDDINGWNFGGYNNNIKDNNGHGTHVAGTIAAEDNGIGIDGVAPDATIMPIKIGDTDSDGYFLNPNASLAKAIIYAVDNGADVINMSLGWTPSVALENALSYAASKNVTTVMAAGNQAGFAPSSPASYATDYGIAVGAVNSNGKMAFFSNLAGYDSDMQYVTAPGQGVYSTLPTYLNPWDNDYGTSSGTSMAAPHVAGTVALMLSANPNLTHDQVQTIVTSSAA